MNLNKQKNIKTPKHNLISRYARATRSADVIKAAKVARLKSFHGFENYLHSVMNRQRNSEVSNKESTNNYNYSNPVKYSTIVSVSVPLVAAT